LALALALSLAAPARAAEREPAASPAKAARPGKVKAAGKYSPSTFISTEEMHKTIAGHKGRVVLLHLWATWCVPCLDELPLIGAFARDMKGKGLEVVSVSLDDATEPAAHKVGKLLHDKTGGALTNVILKTSDADAFIKSVDPRWEGDLPALFAYDQAGRLRKAFIGEATADTLKDLVSPLLAATPR
jgi:thiol-disulfide isomerase/thioredoxin